MQSAARRQTLRVLCQSVFVCKALSGMDQYPGKPPSFFLVVRVRISERLPPKRGQEKDLEWEKNDGKTRLRF